MTPGWCVKVPKTSLPIAWGCFGPLSSFHVDFLLNMASCYFWLFLSHKSPIFGPTWTWNDTWMGHKSAQNIFPHCLGCALVHYPVSRLIFLLNMASCHFGCFLTPKTPIFGPTWTWNGTWMGHKSAQHIFPHCLGCVLTHFPVSRCVIGLIWQPSIMVYFNPKKGHFWTPPDLEWDQERS